MIKTIRHLLAMIRFSHTIFALPFALLGAVMAWCMPGTEFRGIHLVGIVLCMVTARSAAMGFNRLADRTWDAQNPRTRGRHLVTGVLTVRGVTAFTGFMSAAFVASTLLFWPNPLPVVLSIPVLAFLLMYSLTKRFTWAAHFWLGASLMLSPICAWIALRGTQTLAAPSDLAAPTVLGLAILMWVSGFDMIYACQDFQYDVAAGLRSVPARWGIAGALRLAAVCHLAMVLLLLALPAVSVPLDWGWIYYTSVATIALLLVYEHWLVAPHDLTRVNVAFFNINALVSIGLLVAGTTDLCTRF